MSQFVSPQALDVPPASRPDGKKLRRKLQKIGSQRSSVQFTTNNGKISEPRGFLRSAFSSKRNDLNKPTTQVATTSPLPIDLSDPKWDDYLRTSRYTAKEVDSAPRPPFQESLSPPVHIIPEFAHLQAADEKGRKSLETVSTDGPATPSSTSSVASAARRYAKTPVTRIGQLEGIAAHEPPLMQDASSVEAIAESYRALLDSRCSFMEERFMTPFQTFEEIPSDLGARSWEPLHDAPVKAIVDLPQTPKQSMASPASSDGTLVGFEEDAIFFKPIGYSNEQPSPQPRDMRNSPRHVQSSASILPENPTVQIIYDLLTKELSSAASGNMIRPSAETSALQVWLMIEAYEKLKEKIESMELEVEQAHSIGSMFGTWLRTLHTIHENLTGHDGRRSESDYGE
jgi:hypothetical protein